MMGPGDGIPGDGTDILDWPKSLFMFFHKMEWNGMEKPEQTFWTTQYF